MKFSTNNVLVGIFRPNHRQSFRRQEWDTVLLEKDERIYRFFTASQNEVSESPFWFSQETYNQIKNLAGNKPMRDAARAVLAVSYSWSWEMNYMIVGEVTKEFVAAYGQTSGQPMYTKESENEMSNRSVPRNVHFIGGGKQLYIPSQYWGLIRLIECRDMS